LGGVAICHIYGFCPRLSAHGFKVLDVVCFPIFRTQYIDIQLERRGCVKKSFWYEYLAKAKPYSRGF